MSKGEALSIARMLLEPDGYWVPEIGVCSNRQDDGKIVWSVVTNVANLGFHGQVRIDDATGTVMSVHKVPR